MIIYHIAVHIKEDRLRKERFLGHITFDELVCTCDGKQEAVRRLIIEHGRSIDLSNLPLGGADLSMMDFSGADLSRTNLDGATLYGTCFRDATLHGTCFRGADLTYAILDGAHVERADFERAKLVRTSMKNTRLELAHWLATARIRAVTGLDKRRGKFLQALLACAKEAETKT
ncbi:TPA: hypothetical protein DCZ32_00710 [Candidatus Uhrbacteria bacterium]|nr:hypothetical protein [Candidatus Uhrbacteria bacterium]